MKLYSTYSKAGMDMQGRDALSRTLSACLEVENIQYVVETGTYLGLGSTKTIAEAFSAPPAEFVTIEANWTSWGAARKNLTRFPFVTPLWGNSVAREEALAFINEDPAIIHHSAYPDIWIDDINNPQKFYSDEVRGKLGGFGFAELVAKYLHYSGEDLLRKYLSKFKELRPLIVLDSAGGTGYLEFKITQEVMGNNPYILLLDDIHHLKHFRSLRDMKEDKRYLLLSENMEDGWVLAKHQP